jgi:hypothetical protein
MTFNGAKLKAGTPNTILSLYETKNFNVSAFINGTEEMNFMTEVYVLGQTQKASDCRLDRLTETTHYNMSVVDQGIEQRIDVGVQCKYGPTGCLDANSTVECRKYLNVEITKTDTFKSNIVEDAENFMLIEKDYLKAQGECMLEDEGSENKNWECECN